MNSTNCEILPKTPENQTKTRFPKQVETERKPILSENPEEKNWEKTQNFGKVRFTANFRNYKNSKNEKYQN